ncbi:hypothetical protein [Adlercreutzia sp. ZJ154]|uniref:hypothetical protein n=1 Tax=Adlercreutzia sp. ZJ154 TaxID=2709790 RepID=UPI0013E9BA97|nr:hypothetical protein [Adlercreutzia sp. ZJ154]
MKTSKLFGAVALSTTLALGCAMPAFAVTPPDYEGKDTINNANTKVLVNGIAAPTTENQISVTVPVDLPLSVAQKGGNLIAPSASKYAITNSGTKAVKIESVAPEAANKFELADNTLTVPATASKYPETNSQIYLAMKTDAMSTSITLKDPTVTLTEGLFDIAAGETLNLNMSGVAVPSQELYDGTDKKGFDAVNSTHAVTLTYTISIDNA